MNYLSVFMTSDRMGDKLEQVRLLCKSREVFSESLSSRKQMKRGLVKSSKKLAQKLNRAYVWLSSFVIPSRIIERYHGRFNELRMLSVPQGGIQP